MDTLTGKRFLVTGATGGAGGATAAALARQGASVTVVGRDPERTEKARRELPGGGHTSLPNGVYNGIFHAAGVEHMQPLSAVSRETLGRVMDPSVGIAVDLLRDVATKHSILKDGGSIVFMSSVAAVRGTAGMALYSASKAAIEAMARCAAVELAHRRIRVNCIRAGGFTSPMHSRIAARLTQRSIDEYAARHPLGFGKSEDIANLAVFLLSDLSRWVTGACLTADGGYSVL